LTNATTGSGVGPVGSVTTGTVIVSYPIPKFTDGNSYYRLNQTASAGNVTNADARGHYIVSRIANHEVSGYKNGSFVGAYNTLASSGLANLNIYSLGENNNGAALGVPYQLAAITIGASLGTSVSQTIPTALYNRLRTYMTAVGVP
jgi:hypothetical protein